MPDLPRRAPPRSQNRQPLPGTAPPYLPPGRRLRVRGRERRAAESASHPPPERFGGAGEREAIRALRTWSGGLYGSGIARSPFSSAPRSSFVTPCVLPCFVRGV